MDFNNKIFLFWGPHFVIGNDVTNIMEYLLHNIFNGRLKYYA